METAVAVRNLTKRFKRLTALDDVSFDVPSGCLFGLLGPNGAGKTTLFGLASGFLRPDEGTVEVLGHDVREGTSALKGRLSMLPQDADFQGGVPVIEQLVMFGRLTGATKEEAAADARRALEMVGLGEIAEKKPRALSHGMRKRVALCQAFLGDPEVIFLDEPTSGLDPENARRMRELIRSMRQAQTVVISSHNLREIQELCDHVAILNEGELLECGSMAELTSGAFLVRIQFEDPLLPAVGEALAALPAVESVERTSATEVNLRLDFRGAKKADAMKAIYAALAAHDVYPKSIFEGESLETRFLEITGGTYDGASGT